MAEFAFRLTCLLIATLNSLWGKRAGSPPVLWKLFICSIRCVVSLLHIINQEKPYLVLPLYCQQNAHSGMSGVL